MKGWMMKKNKDYTLSSGNVFADLGLPNPDEELAKAKLACKINAIIKQEKFTVAAAADFLDVDQPTIAALSKGKLSEFSLEQLVKFFNKLEMYKKRMKTLEALTRQSQKLNMY
jgi:predicted XRE-type DNA-binding protein